MADNEVVKTEQEETENGKTKGEKSMKEKKQPGKIRKFLHAHKREFIAGGLGVLAGAGGTVGVGFLGKRHAEKKAKPVTQEYNINVSPLDPNVE